MTTTKVAIKSCGAVGAKGEQEAAEKKSHSIDR